MYSIIVQEVHKNSQKHGIFYVHLYCTCNIKKPIKQVKYLLQEKIISLILLHYLRKLKAAKI